jgi:4-hydroxy-4-methyl-2-oxoglutarate aldolase
MTDQELIAAIRQCRPADLSDGMDALGLVNAGSMSSDMRPVVPGIRMAGFAYTVKYVPADKPAKVCSTLEEYEAELSRWCKDLYSFYDPLAYGKGKDKVIVVDMGGIPAGLWGSDIGLKGINDGFAGVVIDGGCRDSYECNLEKVKVWCTKRTFNHVYGRLKSAGVNIPVQCAGITVNPGDIVCGDDDGVLVIPRNQAEKVVKFALEILRKDQISRADGYKEIGLKPDKTLGDFRKIKGRKRKR